MKRIFCLILVVLLLNGCTFRKQQDDSTAFYYCRKTINTSGEGFVVPEYREVSLGSSDLKSLLSLYLIGPQDEELGSPFRGMKLVSAEQDDAHLSLELFCNDRSLTDARFALAAACLTKTCRELLDITQVTVTCGSRSVTMAAEDLLLEDSITTTSNTEETQ